ncbi:murein hydrolase activator EnvC family protein [Maritimibacter alkaliphilus]|uniref:murein hydrolase activator EnvC family protein n=1 Tax=Maritimibacter alkaliphilus TaxID=404236 RepID=UPI001C93C3D9|nr:peptidoglycan DD-metalloendopeptidase family protein [Maritimibacter alkaliphilus]MBY6091336.1 peptidoglycan DD-metalloendopeptidase family protein [Maritimibacter alkaliphilus]
MISLRALLAGLALSLASGAVQAQTAAPTPAEAARAAADQLEAAARTLDGAEEARDRVRALTETLRAYEAGLSAMRDGLRRASMREREIRRELEASDAETAQLLGVLLTVATSPPPAQMVHPDGPLGTARSGMILADVAPALNKKAQALRAKLQEASDLRALQQSAADQLARGMDGVQQARAELSKAIADRTALPKRFTEDPIKTALLIASTETLSAFASGLSDIAENEAPGSLPDVVHRKGRIPMPVQGALLRRAGEADAAGITRPGIVLATRPGAIVTSPTAATIRYRGPLLDYGNVMLLEPQAGVLFVLAGLDVVYGSAGEVLQAGAPVGLMGGQDPDIGAILTQSAGGTGSDRTETLYLEVRQGNTPEDPAEWFAGLDAGKEDGEQ